MKRKKNNKQKSCLLCSVLVKSTNQKFYENIFAKYLEILILKSSAFSIHFRTIPRYKKIVEKVVLKISKL